MLPNSGWTQYQFRLDILPNSGWNVDQFRLDSIPIPALSNSPSHPGELDSRSLHLHCYQKPSRQKKSVSVSNRH
ncbi:hypothetical protein [Scytonema sp. NUACC26]|uniref:hypothetical protein n=1 Tax=Scytonema sp. NUACC26 TaxID=3140176 RepID=UPI0038B2317A